MTRRELMGWILGGLVLAPLAKSSPRPPDLPPDSYPPEVSRPPRLDPTGYSFRGRLASYPTIDEARFRELAKRLARAGARQLDELLEAHLDRSRSW